MTRIRKTGRRLFGAAVLCALGLGAASVLAEPSQAAARNWCRECRDNCFAAGASGFSCNAMDVSCDCIW